MAKTIDFESVNEQQTQVNNEQQTPRAFIPGSKDWFTYGVTDRNDNESDKEFVERIDAILKKDVLTIDGDDDVEFENLDDLDKSVSALKAWLSGYTDLMNCKAKLHFDRLIKEHPSYENVMTFTDNLSIYYTDKMQQSKANNYIKSEVILNENGKPLYTLYQYKVKLDLYDKKISYDTYSGVWEAGLKFYKDFANIERARKKAEQERLENSRIDEQRKQLQKLNDEALALAMSGDIEGAQKIMAKIKVVKEILGIKD